MIAVVFGTDPEVGDSAQEDRQGSELMPPCLPLA